MSPHEQLQQMLKGPEPILALAPMMDVTTPGFWKLLAAHGNADLYVTEYMRVHSSSTLTKRMLKPIVENPTGRPVLAQIIGNDIPSLVRMAQELQEYPIAGIDLNLGCPAPIVYRKCAGSGLLRHPEKIDAILGALREAVRINFTVKTRIGFETPEEFERLVPVYAKHRLDLFTLHGRIARQMNTGPVNYKLIAQAVKALPFPILANGDVHSAPNALKILEMTGAKGLMIGRGAIRNPWLFRQIREHRRGEPVYLPKGREVLAYIRTLYESLPGPPPRENVHVQVMKKYLGFIGDAVGRGGDFLYRVRRAVTEADLFAVCEEFLGHDEPMAMVPQESAPAAAEA